MLQPKLKEAENTSHFKHSRETKFNHILKTTIVCSPFCGKSYIVLLDGTYV